MRPQVGVGPSVENVAVIERAWSIVIWQVPVPVHDPPQPVKTDPGSGWAVRVTTAPSTNPTSQLSVQSTAGRIARDRARDRCLETMTVSVSRVVGVPENRA